MKITVKLVVDLDLDAYRTEYGQPTTAKEAREEMRTLAGEALNAATRHLQPEVIRTVEAV